MNKIFTLLFLLFITYMVNAQQTGVASTPVAQPYGKVDIASLEMKSCDFEKDANAEVLFDVAIMSPYKGLNTSRHTRIKIFNDQGKSEANIRLIYYSFMGALGINDLQGETINLEDGKVVLTPLDKKQIYTEKINLFTSVIVFALPNVKAGSIIEFKYNQYFPDVWYFQQNIPVRYSEVRTDFDANAQFRLIPHVSLPYTKSVGQPTDFQQIKVLTNIPSLSNEPYMTSRKDNLQRMEYIDMNNVNINTWPKIGDIMMKFNDFGYELDRNLAGEKVIINRAKALKTENEKIAFIFDTVKTNMKWNEITSFLTSKDGIVRAWDKKTGNSAEINLIVYDLLKKCDINAYPLVVSTKENGKINPVNANPYLLSNTVVYVAVDSSTYYVLDATNKNNLFNVIPKENLNSFGLRIDEDHKVYAPVFIENEDPTMQSIFLNAEIKAEGKMTGTAQISSFSYNKIDNTERYKADGEAKFTDYLRDDDNNLKLSNLKLENMEDDTLPLVQNANFNMDLTGSDETYIYFNPNLFSGMHKNPFLSESRFTDIDFGYRDNLVINGVFKIPAGYKVDALPKNITLLMPDQSIIFKRVLTQDDNTNSIVVRSVINHKKTIYFKEDYPDFYAFYKKLYELLNEQVVLKKS
jgi:hypothetical protein